jgi:hypothetical protein
MSAGSLKVLIQKKEGGMTDHGKLAREAAMNGEVVLSAFRKVKEGTSVTFVIHPAEMENFDGLATAHLGTRFALALVEIGDDERPKK